MLIGPNGEKRPQSIYSAGIMVAKIATGEIEENYAEGSKAGPLKKPVFLKVTKPDRAAQSTRLQRAK